MENLLPLSEEDFPEIFDLFEGTGVGVLKAWKVQNRLLSRRFVNHINFMFGVTPELTPPPLNENPKSLTTAGLDPATTANTALLTEASVQGMEEETSKLHTPILDAVDVDLDCNSLEVGSDKYMCPPPANSLATESAPDIDALPQSGGESRAGTPPPSRPGCCRMFIIPLPKAHSVDRGGLVESWQAVIANGAKFTSGLCGEGIYMMGSPKEAAYLATLVNVSHIIIVDSYLGRVLSLPHPTRGIVTKDLRRHGYGSVHLAKTGISCLPITDGDLDACTQYRGSGPSAPPQVGFYAVYHPDQVLPHYVVELNNKQQQRRVDELALCAEDASAGLFTFQRVDEPHTPEYEGRFVEGLRAALAPKYSIDAVYHIRNPILRQRFYVALHEFERRQSQMKRRSSQNIAAKFHGSSACLSIIKHGFNTAIRPGMFGKAIYFASDPRKSCNFAPTGELMLCRVGLGRTTVMRVADQSLTAERLRANGCDSVTAPGNKWFSCCFAVNRTEYAIFDPDMAYPEYLIKFTKLVERKAFRSYLVGDALLYKVHSALQPLWAVLFLTMLIAVLYLFVVGITMVITRPEGCSNTTSDRSGRVVWILIFMLLFVLEVVPISLCCCLRAVKPIQTHFGVRKSKNTSGPAAAESSAQLNDSPPSSEVEPPPAEESRCRKLLHTKGPLAILAHLRVWIVFWHVLIIVLSIVIFVVNQLVQCPVYTMLEYDVQDLQPVLTTNINVNRKHFVSLREDGSDSEAWQIEYRGTQVFTTAERSYCVAPVAWGSDGASPRCGQPYVALAACDSADDFKEKMQKTGDKYGGLRAVSGDSPLPQRPMIQHISTGLAPSQFITSMDYFQYVEKDSGFSGLKPWVINQSATDLMATHPYDYDAALSAIGNPTWSWPLCGRHREVVSRNNIHTTDPDPDVPQDINTPRRLTSKEELNSDQQTKDTEVTLITSSRGTITTYSNTTNILITDVPVVVSLNNEDTSTTVVEEEFQEIIVEDAPSFDNETYYNLSYTPEYNNTIEIITTNSYERRTQLIFDFTRPRDYWEDSFNAIGWLICIPLFLGLILFVVTVSCLFRVWHKYPSDEKEDFDLGGAKFRAPEIPPDLPLEPRAFAQAMDQHAGASAPPPRRGRRRKGNHKAAAEAAALDPSVP